MKKSYVMIHYYRYLFVKIKVFNYSELYFSEVTSYKIHTLSKRQIIWEIVSNFVAFLENLNFNLHIRMSLKGSKSSKAKWTCVFSSTSHGVRHNVALCWQVEIQTRAKTKHFEVDHQVWQFRIWFQIGSQIWHGISDNR